METIGKVPERAMEIILDNENKALKTRLKELKFPKEEEFKTYEGLGYKW